MIKSSVIEYIKNHKESWNKLREEFHSTPELPLREFETTKKIKEQLLKYGFEIIEFDGVGIIGVLKHGNSENKIALKASIDGILQKEETDLPYKSVNNSMHANGNDGQIIMLLGACQYLSETREFNGTFYAIFAPGSNIQNGINKLIDRGLFDKIDPQSIFSLKPAPLIQLKKGKVGDLHFINPKTSSSNFIDLFKYKIIGQSSFGSSPENGYDPIVAASSIIMNLQTIVSRNISPFSNAAITVGSIKGGYTANAIAKLVTIKLSVSSNDKETREYILKRIESVIDSTCKAYECNFENVNIGSSTSLQNNGVEYEFAKDLAVDLFDEEKVHIIDNLMINDDISFLLDKKPGTLVFINNGNSDDIYSSKFDFNNQAIPFGVCFFIGLVEKKLK